MRVKSSPALTLTRRRPSRGSFNPRPRAGATERRRRRTRPSSCFNPRPRAGATPSALRTIFMSAGFNPRPRAGATRPIGEAAGKLCFNPRPRAGATQHRRARPLGRAGFNPRPRAGATRGPRGLRRAGGVSIHAPARGRPGRALMQKLPAGFQSTPPRGGDAWPPRVATAPGCFNPRPRAGATIAGSRERRREMVSIHAPARGRLTLAVTSSMARMFQSTPPRGGDPSDCVCTRGRGSFQSTPPRGGDHLGFPLCTTDTWFQSTPPRGGDHVHLGVGRHVVGFNPRPRAGATMNPEDPLTAFEFQSTPPRGGDRVPVRRVPAGRVSIHAPARGRPDAVKKRAMVTLFQSTPPRGGDCRLTLPLSTHTRFNPRPRAGATQRATSPALPQSVSIHAPARGRPFTGGATVNVYSFQSTPPRGGDLPRQPGPAGHGVSIHAPARGRHRGEAVFMAEYQFQSTPPRGGDVPWRRGAGRAPCFNPRPRAGATPRRARRGPGRAVSIHAPARGRPERPCPPCGRTRFQSTPPRGGDGKRACSSGCDLRFNPRPRAGATA